MFTPRSEARFWIHLLLAALALIVLLAVQEC
jgi:hypothetical protein